MSSSSLMLRNNDFVILKMFGDEYIKARKSAIKLQRRAELMPKDDPTPESFRSEVNKLRDYINKMYETFSQSALYGDSVSLPAEGFVVKAARQEMIELSTIVELLGKRVCVPWLTAFTLLASQMRTGSIDLDQMIQLGTLGTPQMVNAASVIEKVRDTLLSKNGMGILSMLRSGNIFDRPLQAMAKVLVEDGEKESIALLDVLRPDVDIGSWIYQQYTQPHTEFEVVKTATTAATTASTWVGNIAYPAVKTYDGNTNILDLYGGQIIVTSQNSSATQQQSVLLMTVQTTKPNFTLGLRAYRRTGVAPQAAVAGTTGSTAMGVLVSDNSTGRTVFCPLNQTGNTYEANTSELGGITWANIYLVNYAANALLAANGQVEIGITIFQIGKQTTQLGMYVGGGVTHGGVIRFGDLVGGLSTNNSSVVGNIRDAVLTRIAGYLSSWALLIRIMFENANYGGAYSTKYGGLGVTKNWLMDPAGWHLSGGVVGFAAYRALWRELVNDIPMLCQFYQIAQPTVTGILDFE